MAGPVVYKDEVTSDVIDVDAIRRDFPILDSLVNGHPLVYLDNAATGQKPQAVIDAISTFYGTTNSNVHRGVHTLSQRATDEYEAARRSVASFLGADDENEIIFTKGTTDSVNLVAHSFGRTILRRGDEVLVSALEHHSNFVPWQMACDASGAKLRVVELETDGSLDIDTFVAAITDKTRAIAITHVSNALGIVVDVLAISKAARAHGIPVIVDGAQAVPHFPVDVVALGVDYYCFSGHKLFGPTGIGVLYGKRAQLETLEPPQGGGGMIDRVRAEQTTWGDLPHRLEAGTPHIAGAIGLAAAIEYVERIGMNRIAAYERHLTSYASERLASVEGLHVFGGPGTKRTGVFSFLLKGAHPYDTGSLLDQLGIAVRTGHHCNQPLMDGLGIDGTVRASFAFYNTVEEVDCLVEGLERVKTMLA